MRDDGRPQDVYAWTRPWVPYGEDPFVWFDPAEDLKRAAAPAPANDARPPRAEPAPRAVAAEAIQAPAPAIAQLGSVSSAADDEHEIWVELPALEEKPKRARRSRSRRGEAVAEPAAMDAVAEALPQPEAEPAGPEPVAAESDAPPAKAPRSRSRGRKAAPAVEAAAFEPAPPETAFEAPVAETPAPQAESAGPEPAMSAPAMLEPAMAEPAPVAREPDPAEITAPPPAPRRGWWRRG